MSTEASVDPQTELAERPLSFAPGLLRGKVVVVSGGGSGIGRATAWMAVRLGASVVVCGRTEDKLLAVADAMRDARVERAIHNIWERHGRIDLLVNSAGGQFPQAAIDYSEKGWNAVINTNLTGTWNVMQQAALKWRETATGGSIVNVVVVPQGLHGVAHTCAARAGVIALSQSLSVEWAPLVRPARRQCCCATFSARS